MRYFIFGFFIAFAHWSIAQGHGNLLTTGFYSIPEKAVRLTNGDWIMAVRSMERPGALFADSILIVRLDAGGNLISKKAVQLVSDEVLEVKDLVATPDTGYVLLTNRSMCDVGESRGSVIKFNKSNNWDWQITSANGNINFPYWVRVAPDGHLIISYKNGIRKLNLKTGAFLWQAPLENVPAGFKIDAFELLPGTEHIGYAYGSQFYYFEQIQDGASIQYRLAFSNILPGNSNSIGQLYPSDTFIGFYGWQRYRDRVLRIIPFQPVDTVALLAFKTWDFQPHGNHFFIWNRENSASYLLQTDWSGTVQDTLLQLDARWAELKTSIADGKMAVYGQYRTGSDIPYYAKAAHTWTHIRSIPSPAVSVPLPDIAITDVRQQAALLLDSTGNGISKRYHLFGGQFRILVKNTGDIPVQQFQIMFALDADRRDVCFASQVKRVSYSGFILQPSDTLSLFFGNISGSGQVNRPDTLCFWVAAPNELPDAISANDVFCLVSNLDFSDTTIHEPNHQFFQIYPNPSSERLYIANAFPDTPYALYALTGARIQSGQCTPLLTELDVSTLSPGMYFLYVGKHVEKIIIHH